MAAYKDTFAAAMRAAEKLLDSRGYDIIDRRWGCDAGEIDLVAKNPETLVFADVSARTAPEEEFPEYGADRLRLRFERIAAAWLADHEVDDCAVRFDQLDVLIVGSKAFIRHHISCCG